MAQHTPGPFVFEATPADHDPDLDLPDNCPFWIADEGGIGEVIALVLETHRGQAAANARLFAAAPDLLSALHAITQRYVTLAESGDCGNWNPEEEPEVQAARAAIEKAEGTERELTADEAAQALGTFVAGKAEGAR